MNKFNPNIHQRRSVRLKDYDYSQAGAYFVTICSYQKGCVFGEVVDGKMQLNEYGKIVEEEWLRSEIIRHEISLDKFIIMPNHVHGIVFINTPFKKSLELRDSNHIRESVGAHGRAPLQRGKFPPIVDRKPKSLGSFIAGFKSVTTKKINQLRNAPSFPLWQRNYHEHVIRNDQSLENIRKYILNNPLQWDFDPENPFSLKDSNIFGRPNWSSVQKEQAFA